MTPPTPQLTEKEKLEIQKLRLEVRYIRRTFFAQIFNTLALLSIGVAVLIFYQWPQISQMEASRVSNERIQVGTMVVAAQALESVQDRNKIIESLAKQWPQYDFIKEIAASNAVIAQSIIVPKPPELSQPAPQSERCDALAKELVKLQKSANSLNVRLQSEVRSREETQIGESSGGPSFFERLFGSTPAEQALRQQYSNVQTLISGVKKNQVAGRC